MPRRTRKKRKQREDSGEAFLPEPEHGAAKAPDDVAEQLAEEFIEAATTGEPPARRDEEENAPEEVGRPLPPTRTP